MERSLCSELPDGAGCGQREPGREGGRALCLAQGEDLELPPGEFGGNPGDRWREAV